MTQHEAEKKLEEVYHAIPRWVHRQFPDLPLAEKVSKAIQHVEITYKDALVREIEEKRQMTGFSGWLAQTHKLNYFHEFWNFLNFTKHQKKSNACPSCGSIYCDGLCNERDDICCGDTE
jgi:hypothetical protein